MAGQRRGLATRRQAAEFLGRKPKTLANWKSMGIGPPCAGSRYPWPELEKWVEAQKDSSPGTRRRGH